MELDLLVPLAGGSFQNPQDLRGTLAMKTPRATLDSWAVGPMGFHVFLDLRATLALRGCWAQMGSHGAQGPVGPSEQQSPLGQPSQASPQ